MTPLKLHYAVGDVTANSRGSKPKNFCSCSFKKSDKEDTRFSHLQLWPLPPWLEKKIVVIYAKYDISKIEKRGE